ncbi:MAG: bacillithiol system redox-active protein YtxJ [Crocinitomicaceae bacterium]|nr:bacillithiol system redox-active protein YtxJ [Crocinitomicaceae bacterium]MDG1657634.1 bacillithiol system redox-active protein YtxJ [Crocinitomicaceae bacterium]|tara:strand:- start:7928 stop:8299 length:372 start_codon:yes stop_codon:yes gene_type:complete
MGWFGKSQESKELPWNQLTSVDQLKEVLDSSTEKPILLFKHSTRCSISSMAFSGFQSGWEGTEEEIGIYYLDLLNYRDISNQIAELTGVMHQSPQVIVLKNNEVVYTATHTAISARAALSSIS